MEEIWNLASKTPLPETIQDGDFAMNSSNNGISIPEVLYNVTKASIEN